MSNLPKFMKICLPHPPKELEDDLLLDVFWQQLVDQVRLRQKDICKCTYISFWSSNRKHINLCQNDFNRTESGKPCIFRYCKYHQEVVGKKYFFKFNDEYICSEYFMDYMRLNVLDWNKNSNPDLDYNIILDIEFEAVQGLTELIGR